MTTNPDREILIARVIDGEATPEDWQTIRTLAASDPTLWGDLAESQSNHDQLRAAVGELVAIADSIEAPIREHAAVSLAQRLGLVGRWGGWAVAAAVLLAWSVGLLGTPSGTDSLHAGLGPDLQPIQSPDQALDTYLEQGKAVGRVVRQKPGLVILDTNPINDGKDLEIIYLRQIVERAVVDNLYRVSRDESGRLVPIPVDRLPGPSKPF